MTFTVQLIQDRLSSPLTRLNGSCMFWH